MSSDLDFLNSDSNVAYGLQPIPVERDREISERLRRAMAAGRIAELESKVDEEHELVFRAFAERMATLAVREQSGDPIEVGLVALSLGGLKGPTRESLIVLSLLIDAARRVGESPGHLLNRIAEPLGDDARTGVLNFLARTEEGQAIAAMGFVLGADNDGPRYVSCG